MRQDELSPAPGSKKDRKRVGRGPGSGHGWYSGRGCKGQKSRSGNRKMPRGFEGGQLPIMKRLPRKRGFFNLFRTEYSVVNVGNLDIFDANAEITPEMLLESGLVESLQHPVKILANGEVSKPLVIKANKFSGAARAKIEAAGGKVVEI
ncbi:MAG: 50S ribosomal protein L15 [Dehalococcoidia bacterium]|nr:50S ribosomal protein L15 [Dehalococcoidia bacterium]